MERVVIQRAIEAHAVPADDELQRWITGVLDEFKETREVTVRIVGADEMQLLNREYRNKNSTTNVLSFPVEDEFNLHHGVLGDIVVCADVVNEEATEQEKTVAAHWAHIVMHGTLHLLGFDHIDDDQATEMEAHEVRILSGFGFSNPYFMTQNGCQNV